MARGNVRDQATASARNLKPVERLKSEASGLVDALGDRAVTSLRDKVDGAADRLTGYVEDGAGPGLMTAVTGAKNLAEGKGPVRSLLGAGVKGAREQVAGAFRGLGSGLSGGVGGLGKAKGGTRKLKVTNIVESVDVGVPIGLAYDQWTQFTAFPTFMKKVENVEQAEDNKLNWQARVLWSSRNWQATILEQHPEDKIVWRSTGDKGHVDGAVTFHALAPNLTRVIVVLEYHPRGLFEQAGNIWRAQGRRVRLEMKHFRRHVMSEAIMHQDDVRGWRGTIEDGEVVDDEEDEVQLDEDQEDEARDGPAGRRARRSTARGGDRQ